MTPTQQRIMDHLAARSPAIVSGYELRDATCPKAGVKSVHVQIHKIRSQGIRVQTFRGMYGGYRTVARP